MEETLTQLPQPYLLLCKAASGMHSVLMALEHGLLLQLQAWAPVRARLLGLVEMQALQVFVLLAPSQCGVCSE